MEVNIVEVRMKIVDIESDNKDEALQYAKEMYESGEIELGYDELISLDIFTHDYRGFSEMQDELENLAYENKRMVQKLLSLGVGVLEIPCQSDKILSRTDNERRSRF